MKYPTADEIRNEMCMSSETLDDIFERIKRASREGYNYIQYYGDLTSIEEQYIRTLGYTLMWSDITYGWDISW